MTTDLSNLKRGELGADYRRLVELGRVMDEGLEAMLRIHRACPKRRRCGGLQSWRDA